MLILGIESSCDDMAAAVVKDGRHILSSVVSSQDAVHKKYGGIVPELASRKHLETIIPVVEEALSQAGVILDDIGAIGVTQGPGLVGSILIGLSFAKSIAYVKNIPFTGVNHIEAHPMAIFLGEKGGTGAFAAPEFPFIALVVSGGHTSLLKFKDFGAYETIGQTRDDAAGEAFDKVAKILGLGYPGGAIIDRLARDGDPTAINFTRPYISKDTLDFSFSGLKTAAMTYINKHGIRDAALNQKLHNSAAQDSSAATGLIKDLAAGFQEAVVDVLTDKAMSACVKNGIKELVAAGGVACNSRLREKLRRSAEHNGIRLYLPDASLCSDNGAMIAATAYHRINRGHIGSLDMNALPNMSGSATK